ncbi:uncharacterized protein, partial [Aegilops tauschii subsp. strangulata]
RAVYGKNAPSLPSAKRQNNGRQTRSTPTARYLFSPSLPPARYLFSPSLPSPTPTRSAPTAAPAAPRSAASSPRRPSPRPASSSALPGSSPPRSPSPGRPPRLYYAVDALLRSGHEDVYAAVERPLQLAQTAAVLEILHGLVGLVRSPVSATLPQIGSRLFVTWGILWSFPETRTHILVSSLVISCSITEVGGSY